MIVFLVVFAQRPPQRSLRQKKFTRAYDVENHIMYKVWTLMDMRYRVGRCELKWNRGRRNICKGGEAAARTMIVHPRGERATAESAGHRVEVGHPLGSRAPVTMRRRSTRGLKTCQLLESPAKLININYAKRDESTVFSVGRFFCSGYQAGGTSCVAPLSWQILIVGRSAN